MKILCCCLRACLLTGSELYFYELSDALSQLGHDVTLGATEISDFFVNKCANFPVKNLRDIKASDFDLIILSHPLETFSIIENQIGNTPIVDIVHSEIYPNEVPLLHKNVVKYVGIRPSICDKIKSLNVQADKIHLIRNPIDLNKFNTANTKDDNYGLFVGTMGGVRYKAALHFAQHCKHNHLKSIYISAENVSVPFFDVCLPSCSNVEMYFKNCSISGGVIQGRTYFEARLCGKPTIEYYINNMGMITNIDYEDKPSLEELEILQEQFDKYKVAQKIIAV